LQATRKKTAHTRDFLIQRKVRGGIPKGEMCKKLHKNNIRSHKNITNISKKVGPHDPKKKGNTQNIENDPQYVKENTNLVEEGGKNGETIAPTKH